MMEKNFATSAKSPLTHYDALADKHASFYFNAHGVKKHLKKLKKALNLEPQSKHLHQYSQMLDRKITELTEDQNHFNFKIQPYQQTLKPASLYKLQRLQNFFEEKPKQSCLKRKTDSCKTVTGNSLQALPHLGKINQSTHHNLYQKDQKPCFQSQNPNKDKKSVSSIPKEPTVKNNPRLSRPLQMKLPRERSNVSVDAGKRENMVPLKEVKHEQFMLFLRKRQEKLKKKGLLHKDQEHSQEINGSISQTIDP